METLKYFDEYKKNIGLQYMYKVFSSSSHIVKDILYGKVVN